jgi:hypothetical protein
MFNKIRHPIALILFGTLLACTEPTTVTNDPVQETEPTATAAENILGEEVSSDPVHGEQLLARAPDGWQQGFATNTAALRMVEFIPGDASRGDWAEKVTFESLRGDPLPDPIDFVTGIGSDQSGTCERFEQFNIQSGFENNYPTSVRLLTCSRNKLTDKGQVTLIKAIRGNDHFYVITRAKRIPPVAEGAESISEQEMANWSAYMRAITVCDSAREEHPCSNEEEPASATPPV